MYFNTKTFIRHATKYVRYLYYSQGTTVFIPILEYPKPKDQKLGLVKILNIKLVIRNEPLTP